MSDDPKEKRTKLIVSIVALLAFIMIPVGLLLPMYVENTINSTIGFIIAGIGVAMLAVVFFIHWSVFGGIDTR